MTAEASFPVQALTLDTLHNLSLSGLANGKRVEASFISSPSGRKYHFSLVVEAHESKVHVFCEQKGEQGYSKKVKAKTARLAELYVITSPSLPEDLFSITVITKPDEVRAEILGELKLSRCIKLCTFEKKVPVKLRKEILSQILNGKKHEKDTEPEWFTANELCQLIELSIWDEQPAHMRAEFYLRLPLEQFREVFKSLSLAKKAEVLNVLANEQLLRKPTSELLLSETETSEAYTLVSVESAYDQSDVGVAQCFINQLIQESLHTSELWDGVLDKLEPECLKFVIKVVSDSAYYRSFNTIPNFQKSLLASSLPTLLIAGQCVPEEEFDNIDPILRLTLLLGKKEALLADLKSVSQEVVTGFLQIILSKHPSGKEPNSALADLINGVINDEYLKALLITCVLYKLEDSQLETFYVHIKDLDLGELLKASIEYQQSLDSCARRVYLTNPPQYIDASIRMVATRISRSEESRHFFQGLLNITKEEVKQLWHVLNDSRIKMTVFLYCCSVAVSKEVVMEMALNKQFVTLDDPYPTKGENADLANAAELEELIPYLTDDVWLKMLSVPYILFHQNPYYISRNLLLSNLEPAIALKLIKSQTSHEGCHQVVRNLSQDQLNKIMRRMEKNPDEFLSLSDFQKTELLFNCASIESSLHFMQESIGNDDDKLREFRLVLQRVGKAMLEYDESRFHSLIKTFYIDQDIAIEMLSELNPEQFLNTWLSLYPLNIYPSITPLRNRLCRENQMKVSMLESKEKGIEVLYTLLHREQYSLLKEIAQNMSTEEEVLELQDVFKKHHPGTSEEFNQWFCKGS
ncbi:hypothetical protein [Parashewanella tropica]|uniref:hypothetical protein n=1 Tax=Parashewanella tropica TaxID=2547970 RepID=UPI00105A2950|nr:hypothetical protein [Parashewanella tropica]